MFEKEPKLGKKGQGALEYMMTYGWAILIMGVVVVVLWQMKVFNPATTPPGKSGFSQVLPVDWRVVKSTNNVSMTLSNDAGTKVLLTAVGVNISGTSCGILLNKEMRAGENYAVGVEGCTVPDAKSYYSAEVTITYQNIASTIDHRSVGEIHGSVEP